MTFPATRVRTLPDDHPRLPEGAVRHRTTMLLAVLTPLLSACPEGPRPHEPPARAHDSGREDTGGHDTAVVDADGDGQAVDVDCDDGAATVFPGAPEVCDGLDNDCNGHADDPYVCNWTDALRAFPALPWVEQPDWINVRTDVTPGAAGDGIQDDTHAIQAALDLLSPNVDAPKVVYLPPGTYRITRTLTAPGSVGSQLLGHGRDTRIVWDGDADGSAMLRSNGMAQGTYLGLVWDGNGRADVGVDHAAHERFESAVRHRLEAFVGLRVGIRGGADPSAYASSEMEVDASLFQGLGRGVQFLYYNYYNESVTRGTFLDCAVGVEQTAGNVYNRDLRFERSTVADLLAGGLSGDSARRIVSLGSARLLQPSGGHAQLHVQDAYVAGWTATDGAIRGQPKGSWILQDLTFRDAPDASPPVNTSLARATYLSRVDAPDTTTITPPLPSWATPAVWFPDGDAPSVALDAGTRFLPEHVGVPQRVFNAVTDFGAANDGATDSTDAVQATIDAARAHGAGAMAYFPNGTYAISRPIDIHGSDYVVSGNGSATHFRWGPATPGDVFRVHDAEDVHLTSFSVPFVPDGGTAIHHIGLYASATVGRDRTSVRYDRMFVDDGNRRLGRPTENGLLVDGLGPDEHVYIGRVDGQLAFVGSGEGHIVGDFMNANGLTVDSAGGGRGGFIGFDALNGHNVQVFGNADLIIGDLYEEQSGDFGRIGSTMNNVAVYGDGRGSGHVTIGGARMFQVDSDRMLRIDGYTGTVAYISASTDVSVETGDSYVIETRGSHPVDVVTLGNAYASVPVVHHPDADGDGRSAARSVRYGHADNTELPEAWFTDSPTRIASPVAADAADTPQALFLDGVDDYVRGPADTRGRQRTPLTVAFWIRPAMPMTGRVVALARAQDDLLDWAIDLEDGHVVVRTMDSTRARYESPPTETALTADTWRHVAVVQDGDTASVYVDGVLEVTAPILPDGAEFLLAYQRFLSVGGYPEAIPFMGAVDDLRIYDSALSEDDLAFILGDGAGTTADLPSGAPAWLHWSFDESLGGMFVDRSGNGAQGQAAEWGVDHTPPDGPATVSGVLDHFRRLGVALHEAHRDAFSLHP